MKKDFIITKAYPQGFCKGVTNAIKIAKEASVNPKTIKPIYILGSIVHNKKITEAFEFLGLKKITIEDLDNIPKGTIIITAHGVSPSVYRKILNKGLDIIDTTCDKVKELHNKVKDALNNNKNIYFLGMKHHEETLGILGISDKIQLIEVNNVNYDITIKDDSILLCQTTLPFNIALDIYNKLKENNPSLTLEKEICDASYSRQMGILKIANNNDIVLVIGDKLSNNCNSLLETVKQVNTNSYLIEDIGDLKNINFNNINKIAITSAASTPRVIVDEVIDALKNLESSDFLTKIKIINYLKV